MLEQFVDGPSGRSSTSYLEKDKPKEKPQYSPEDQKNVPLKDSEWKPRRSTYKKYHTTQ